ncbi:ubiquitin carboxyl-terminal hydrolase isozyme L5-like [Micractinium conductrix]|uniref:Ubiquitin carboxyl-terminal hydrolase n=1 Tax=Micractinium conductrix TaxID=554055 RepID=A0A2P6V4D1_9CHLO|nr:ubiquitin carboxyl-terminal hydrolase isozyme L5-like [Micractinium conductrix]|eukprot:PSC68946.1 ubiquitin carboxyl-terminal hydrolase isozyme L5-like [Micractinium conductrix]
MGDHWTTIESDPGVFSELLERMGVKGVQMEELYSLDEDSLDSLRPIYGLIFLFKWQKEEDSRPVEANPEEAGVFFASQVIHNACATQAIVSVLLNRPELEIGPELSQLKEFVAGMPAAMKGLAIGNSDTIRSVHNSFSPPQPIIPEKDDDDEKGEAFHFLAYVPVGGALWELDGLKPGPIQLAECTDGDWLPKAAAAITERIGRYAASEVKFNLMACIEDRRRKYSRELAQQMHLQERIRAKLGKSEPPAPLPAAGAGAGDAAAAAAEELPDDADTLAVRLSESEAEAERLQAQLAMEEDKRARWAEENVRRRTDYIPFSFQLLMALAEKGQLQPLVERAQEAHRAKLQQQGGKVEQ